MKTYNNFSELPGAESATNVSGISAFNDVATGNMSPKFATVSAYNGRDFFIESREDQHGGVLEPAHTHIWIDHNKRREKAKFWLVNPSTPVNVPQVFQVSAASTNHLPDYIENSIIKHLNKNKSAAIRDWNDYVDEKHPESVCRKISENR